MKILFLTTQFPYPLDNGGKIGAYNGLQVLSDHDLTVLSFTEDPEKVDNGMEFYEAYPQISFIKPIYHDIHIRKKYMKLLLTIIKAYFSRYPYLCVKFKDKKMIQEIDKCMKNHYYDMIFIDYLNMEIYGDYIRKKYKDNFGKYVLKDHNIEYEIIKQAADDSGFIKKCLLTPLWRKTMKFEHSAIKRADIVFSVCDENASYMKDYNKKSYTMKPVFAIKPYTKNKMNKKLLYIGNLSWKPNLDGLIWFVNNVWSNLRTEFPEIEMDIVGSGNVDNLFVNVNGINWLGFVDDLEEIYMGHHIFVVPLFEGSGIRIKILEAFNNNIPVVSTSIASATIGAENKTMLLQADTPAEFRDAIKYLIEDEECCVRLVKNAKQFLQNNFSLEQRQKEINSIINRI